MAFDPFITRQPDYKDLDLDFIANPTTGDIVRKTGPDAIKRAVRNLIFTNFYDRPFQSYLGSNIRALLFDNANALTSIHIKDAVKELIDNYETRVALQQVNVSVDLDNNGYNVSLVYTIKNTNVTVPVSLFLERIR
jgi:phage baseplate assembly protein W